LKTKILSECFELSTGFCDFAKIAEDHGELTVKTIPPEQPERGFYVSVIRAVKVNRRIYL